RNFYLSGASELRNGVFDLPSPSSSSADNVTAMTTQLFWDYLAMRLNGAEAGDRRITLVCELPDIEELWTLMLRHGTLSHRAGAEEGADATVTIDRADLNRVILKGATLEELLGDGTARIDGDAAALHDLLGLLDDFDFWFNIVTP
ncbi:MAG TPA: alkyl sulfatase C-terminal domain-containing protein, partial [Solirubrobacterales bacterium]|nr:alkyl sulfatase C-terminal domain-containing protein [Solirubrobacterales bacterium]